MATPAPKPFHCSDCGKEFSKEKNLISHFKVHSTEKSYKCQVCKVTFYTKLIYKNHLKTHVEKGNYPCPECGKIFIRNSWLKRHVSLQCDDSKEKNNKFICKVCGKSYDSITGVKSHLNKGKHSEVEFKCHACKWMTDSSKTLFVHVLQHSNADIIIVGFTTDNHLEYYSTSKVRSRLAKYQPRSSTNTGNKKLTGKDKLQECQDDVLTKYSQNMIQNTKTDLETNKLSFAKDSNIQTEYLTYSRSSSPADNAEKERSEMNVTDESNLKIVNLEEENIQDIEAKLRNGWIRARISSERPNVFDSKLSDSQTSTKEKTHESISSDKRELPIEKLHEIPKKMPKLLSLYPDEEASSKDIENLSANHTLLLPNEALNKNLLYKNISPEISTLMSNPLVLPFANHLVNTMFLPPLFILPTSSPSNQGMTQPPIQIQSEIFKSPQIQNDISNIQPVQRNIFGSHTINQIPGNSKTTSENMPNELTFKRERKKECKDQFEDPLPNASGQNSRVKTQEIGSPNALLDNGPFSVDNAKQKFAFTSHTNVHPLTEMQELSNLIQHEKGVKNSRSENKLWDTLIENESSGLTIHSFPINNVKDLSVSDMLQNSNNFQDTSEEKQTLPDTVTPEENVQRITSGKAVTKNKENTIKGGVDVEDYIKKFMWL